jgi:hypothetical protein
MSTSKKKESNDRGAVKTPKSVVQLRASKSSITTFTQDPNEVGCTLVPSSGPYVIDTPGNIIICGPISLPGQSFTISAKDIGTRPDSKGQAAAIDVSGAPGAPPADLPPASAGTNGATGPPGPGMWGPVMIYPGPAGNGSSGGSGSPGGDGGDININVKNVTPGASLLLKAEGGRGGQGQNGQPGGAGGAGAEGNGVVIPAGNGGAGGTGGNGGPGGSGGTISISCPADSSNAFIPSVQRGAPGAGGGGGAGGPAGGKFSSPGASGQTGNPGGPSADGEININE